MTQSSNRGQGLSGSEWSRFLDAWQAVTFIALLGAVACGSGSATPGGVPDGAIAAPDALVPTCTVGTSDDSMVVALDTGLARGTVRGQTHAFLGVPYAAPPVGALRFLPPAAAACWSAVREATEFGAQCLQHDVVTGNVVGDEDCLTLNVWTPAPDSASDPVAARPVMFFLYGGANVLGATNTDPLGANLYDGELLAARTGAVVITVNYRVGVMGFFAHNGLDEESVHATSGNQGIHDQLAALAWVQRNAQAFGGDPARVMVFGESAGAMNTCTLVASPLGAGLFSRALMQSGACGAVPQSVAKARSEAVATAMGCTDADPMACLRDKSGADIVAATGSFAASLSTVPDPSAGVVGSMPWAQSIDGFVLPDAPLAIIRAGAHNQVPMVIGSNSNEFATFSALSPSVSLTCNQLRDRIDATFGTNAASVAAAYPCDVFGARQTEIDLFTDLMFTCPARRAARAIAEQQDAPVYRYWYTHGFRLGVLAALSAGHAMELPFVFGTFAAFAYVPLPSERELSDVMQASWATFAATGRPEAVSATWPPVAGGASPLQVLGTARMAIDGVRDDKCDLWDQLYPLSTGG